MSDKILKALMQLFAILANADRLSDHGRNIVEAFLRQQLSQSTVKIYLEVFDDYLKFLQGKSDPNKIQKRVAANSVKILRICVDINSELDKKQKYIVLIRLIEFAYSSSEVITELESELLSMVANTFHVSEEEFDTCLSFSANKSSESMKDSPEFMLINNNHDLRRNYSKHVISETLNGDLWILNIQSAGILFVKYFGDNRLTLNGQVLLNDTSYVFSRGSVIRGAQVRPVYYSDVARYFLDDNLQAEIAFATRNIEYIFRNGKKGLHSLSFSASSGNLIGIMGGSGAGKSTLLNILNGNNSPSDGEVLINGFNLHRDRKKLEGVIGYVPQDDLLMEDLTVFQNLYYNSKLCFGNLTNIEITDKVNQLLETVGLYEAKDLKTGDALNATISGGQRKRLNIALELIRTPAVLFVDEPTSGLSSLDSENVMDLLKQLAISGKLVFVVIHQPSSDIFKLFDKLLILDSGGYPVYYGDPSDSLIYFKKKGNYADADESECGTCGNLNPEQVFSIIESKIMDEFGNPTLTRKISSEEWNQFYKESFDNRMSEDEHEITFGNSKKDQAVSVPGSSNKKPGRLKQLIVFMQRDVLSKLQNTQYLLINFFEAPVLAFILSYFLKYYNQGSDYVFRENVNLFAYIFMSVIVALFMGLSVSAEEIIRDRKILKRESFLNLSRSSYLISKIGILFLISAIQTFSFVILGNLIFGIKDMFFDYWLILFSVSCFSNLLGLNISSSFDSAVTIYILIPFLIIPQIILSGVIVKFENLNPTVTAQDKVPGIGEIMASRWAFEALAVNQFKNNEYEKNFFAVEKQMSNATYKKDFWLVKMNDKLDSIHSNKYGTSLNDQIALLKKELDKELKISPSLKLSPLPEVNSASTNESAYKKLKSSFDDLKKNYIRQYNFSNKKKNELVNSMMKNGENNLSALKDAYTNESLNDMVLDRNNLDLIVEGRHELIQRFQPVFMDGSANSFIRAPFYVSRKNIFGHYYSTYFINFIVIWKMTFILAVTLYFNLLKKLLNEINNFFDWVKTKVKRS